MDDFVAASCHSLTTRYHTHRETKSPIIVTDAESEGSDGTTTRPHSQFGTTNSRLPVTATDLNRSQRSCRPAMASMSSNQTALAMSAWHLRRHRGSTFGSGALGTRPPSPLGTHEVEPERPIEPPP